MDRDLQSGPSGDGGNEHHILSDDYDLDPTDPTDLRDLMKVVDDDWSDLDDFIQQHLCTKPSEPSKLEKCEPTELLDKVNKSMPVGLQFSMTDTDNGVQFVLSPTRRQSAGIEQFSSSSNCCLDLETESRVDTGDELMEVDDDRDDRDDRKYWDDDWIKKENILYESLKRSVPISKLNSLVDPSSLYRYNYFHEAHAMSYEPFGYKFNEETAPFNKKFTLYQKVYIEKEEKVLFSELVAFKYYDEESREARTLVDEFVVVPNQTNYLVSPSGFIVHKKNQYKVSKGNKNNNQLVRNVSSKEKKKSGLPKGQKSTRIDRMVWETFKFNIPEDWMIQKLDGNNFNNFISNMKLVPKKTKKVQIGGHVRINVNASSHEDMIDMLCPEEFAKSAPKSDIEDIEILSLSEKMIPLDIS